jgi:hypothetical protein
MRYRLMATYRGVPYEAGVGPSNSDVVLFAACPPPEALGFEPATGHWRKQVIRAEIDALWESRPVGVFRGEPCIVLDDLGERLHIAYLGTEAERAGQLGYWQVDRGVFELLTPRDEVTGLTEERVDRPLRWSEHPDGSQAVTANPYGTAPWPVLIPPGTPPGPAPESGPAPAAALSGGPAAARSAGPGAAPSSGPGAALSSGPGAALSSGPAAVSPSAAPPSPADPYLAQPAARVLAAPPLAGPSGPGFPPPPAADRQPGFPAASGPPAVPAPAAYPGLAHDSEPAGPPGLDPGGRAARRQRVPTREIFCELADLAAIPRSAYALESETDGALCLLPTLDGFEVFTSANGARHEVRTFAEEEAAYFYLFGVLAAEAIRNGTLAPAVVAAGLRPGGI